MSQLYIRTAKEADELLDRLRLSAVRFHHWVSAQSGDPLDMLKRMKFDKIGFHPIDHRPLNLVEQINQLWTHSVAVAAVRQLLEFHPDAEGFHLAPGAHASLPLDIMSHVDGLVGAETFAAVDPKNNEKLAKDIYKLANRSEQHRYVFFMSPLFPKNERQVALERDGVQVWSVNF
jgi:hypothetical protein